MIDQHHRSKGLAFWGTVAFLLGGLILYFSLTPNPPDLPGNFDKYGHVAGYALLMFWLMQHYKGSRSRVIIAAALVLGGIALEMLQALGGYRNFERADMLADGIGVALGWLAGPPRTANLLDRSSIEL
jgi:VanZ family protein